MFKRVTIVALVVAAFVLVMAVPALAFNGMRGDYTTTKACQACHAGVAGIPTIYPRWAGTKHAIDEEADSAALTLPYGSVCAGCHTSNYAPSKVTPVPTATSGTGSVSWGASPSTADQAMQTTGDAAFSENFIGCSSCHYGANVGGGLEIYGVDTNDSAHSVPYGNMADAQICGACHSRYSYTKNTIAVQPIPTPTVVPTTLIQPQMAIGYPMLGSPSPSPAWSPVLTDFLVLSYPGWTPTPTATTAGFARLQTFWQVDGHDTVWEQSGHDGGAQQYPEWVSEGLDKGHAGALKTLKDIGQSKNPECLQCHSADYRIMKEAGKLQTADQQNSFTPKYGVTCVGCHTPHDAGTAKGRWDEAFDTQLIGDPANPSNVCTTCHNGDLPEGTTASPGAEIHHPMKEMMDGYGAIDVASFPSVHKGKCIQCHMPPTTISRGVVQLGGNHTYNLITPREAVDASPVPYVTSAAVAIATATPVPGGTPVVTSSAVATWDSMPYSACSTCHSNNNGVKATPLPVGTRTITPSPSSSPIRVTVITDQLANGTAVGNMTGGDKAIWLQDTIDQRQEWTHAKVTEIWAELDTAAKHLGYADTDAAHTALVAVPAAKWTTAERAFLSGFTNVEFVDSEGSFGLHNWDYSREIVNTAMMQAKIAATGVVVRTPWVVTLKMSKANVRAGTTVRFTGNVKTSRGVAGAGTVRIMRRVGGTWQVWLRGNLNSSGNYSISHKLTRTGTFRVRALMPANTTSLGAYSPKSLKLVVRR
jgi:plastocyanin